MADPRRVALRHEERFPHGAYAVGVGPVAEFDGDRGRTGAQARDRDTGLPLWAVEVLDPDPEGRVHQVRVRLATIEEPELPPMVRVPGTEHGLRPVWFGGLVGTPYLDSNGRRPRVGWSLRAESMTAPPSAEVLAGMTGTGAGETAAAESGAGVAGRRGATGGADAKRTPPPT